MKYIVTKCEEHGEEIFTFPDNINHDMMFEVLGYIDFRGDGYTFHSAISAGFVDDGMCFGKSTTLNLQSRPVADTVLLNNQ